MGTIQTPLQNLMKKKMTRKEFLGAVGMAALIVLNIEPILKMLTKGSSQNSAPTATDNYDAGVYGGSDGKGLS